MKKKVLIIVENAPVPSRVSGRKQPHQQAQARLESADIADQGRRILDMLEPSLTARSAPV